MIEFPCHCGFKLSVPAEMAGSLIQCPQCSRLNDVPTLAELEHMDADGALQMNPKIERTEDAEARVAALTRAFTRSKYDEHGQPIDLRPTFDDVLDLGAEDGTIPLADEIKPEQPKYDPTTGELVRPLDVKPENAPPPGPHPAIAAHQKPSKALSYENQIVIRPMTFKNLTLRLFEPVNLLVMLIILFFHALFTPVSVLMSIGLFLIAPLWIIELMFFVGHYGCVIEEIGPAERDELPRPMRDFSFSEDIWRPFTCIGGAFFICFLPIIVGEIKGVAMPDIAVLALGAAGAFFFPAVLLTLSTSGTVHNLRPDRVMGVISIIGARYFVLVAAFIVAVFCYYYGLMRMNLDLALLFVSPSTAASLSANFAWWFQRYFTYPMLILAIYLSHWFCAALGTMYRAYQPHFPWILQRHVATKLAERNRPSPQRLANVNSAKARARMVEPLAPRMPR